MDTQFGTGGGAVTTDGVQPGSILISEVSGVTVLRCTGPISLMTVPSLHDALHAAVRLGRPTIVNVAAVTYLDLTGLREIEHIRRIAPHHPVVLVAVDTRVCRLIRLNRLDEIVSIFATEDTALAALQNPNAAQLGVRSDD